MLVYQQRAAFLCLIDQIRTALGYSIRKEDISQIDDIAMEMNYGGYEFSLVHSVRNSPEKILIECVFGEFPSEKKEKILLNIAHMNYALAEIDGSIFCFDEETERIIYTISLDLSDNDANQILRKMTEIVWHGRRWSDNFFIKKVRDEGQTVLSISTLA